MKTIVLKRLGIRKLSDSSEMQNDALKHREDSAGIDFSCQNLTSVDVRFGRLNSIPAL